MSQFRAKITEGGRIVIPAEYRKALGVRIGDELILRLENNAVQILTPRQAIRQAQELVRAFVPRERTLSGELIAERQSEAEHE